MTQFVTDDANFTGIATCAGIELTTIRAIDPNEDIGFDPDLETAVIIVTVDFMGMSGSNAVGVKKWATFKMISGAITQVGVGFLGSILGNTPLLGVSTDIDVDDGKIRARASGTLLADVNWAAAMKFCIFSPD